MTTTTFATGNALTRKIWEAENEKLFRDAIKESYFSKFMGSGPLDKSSIVYVNNSLQKSAGDKITFGIRMRLTGAGVGSGETLEGNEEALTTYDFSVTMDRRRNGVRVTRGLTKQRVQMDLEEEARAGLKDWMTEFIDSKLFEALRATAPTSCWYSNNGVITKGVAATIKADLVTAEDKITTDLISAVKTWALTGGARSQTPLRPIKIEGKNHFVLLVHPDVGYDLRKDATFVQANREAASRGTDNPIFTGMLGMWNNVIIHEHENIHIGTDAGASANVPYAENFLLGAQSLCWANGMREDMVEETFDYQEQAGFGIGLNYAVGKPIFNSLDYGSVGIYTSRTKVSDL